MVRVFHCDDSAAYRALIRAELEGDPEIEIVGGASSVRGALGPVSEVAPDVVLLDLLDTNDDAVGELLGAAPAAKVVVLSGHPREFGEGRRSGAVAYVEKAAPVSELRETVLRAAAG